MIKNKLIDQIVDKILQEKPEIDRDYMADERRIELDIAAAVNTIYFQIFKKTPSNLDRYTKSYYNIPIIQDSNTLTWYSALPAKIIQFPTIGDGVWRINDMQGTTVNFKPIKEKDIEYMESTDVGNISSVIWYVVRSQTSGGSSFNGIVEYYNPNVVLPSVVKMDLVPDFTEWLPTEDYPIPAGQDQNLINMVVQQFKFKPAHRISNEQEL